MPAPILIVGQGVAGTLLAWAFERAGIDFEIADAGHAEAASLVAAGIVNPITGQRFVKSWRVDELLPLARAVYRELEAELRLPLVREMRVWRMFSRPNDREVAWAKVTRGDWQGYVVPESFTEEGFWIDSALQVDLPALLQATRARWLAQGRLQQRRVALSEEYGKRDLIIRCLGVSALSEPGTQGLYDRAKGELMKVELEKGDLPSDVIRNRGPWLLPLPEHRALIGSTYERDVLDLAPTAKSLSVLRGYAAELLSGRSFTVVTQLAGWRVSAPDLRPVAGRLCNDRHCGEVNGLGSKGTLYAPWIARQWVNHLTEGVPFDPDLDLGRFTTR